MDAPGPFPTLSGIEPQHVGKFHNTGIFPLLTLIETIKHCIEGFRVPSERVMWCDWIESNVTSSKFHKKLLVIGRYSLFFFKKALLGKGITVWLICISVRNFPSLTELSTF